MQNDFLVYSTCQFPPFQLIIMQVYAAVEVLQGIECLCSFTFRTAFFQLLKPIVTNVDGFVFPKSQHGAHNTVPIDL